MGISIISFTNAKENTRNAFEYADDWILTPDEVTTCINLPKTLRPKITNTGSEPLIITKWTIPDYSGNSSGSVNDFMINLILPITLQSGESLVIPITFTPSGRYINAVFYFVVETNSLRKPKDTVNLTVTATFDQLISKAKLDIKDNKSSIEPGTAESVTYTVELNRSKIIVDATIPNFKVAVTYSLDFLGLAFNDAAHTPGLAKVVISSQLASSGYVMLPIDRKVDKVSNTETITLTFSGSESIFKQAGNIELITITFDAIAAYYQGIEENIGMKSRTTKICHEVLTDDPCIMVKGDCAAMQISDPKYNLQEVNPNPVSSDGGYINFGVGDDNFITEIKIFNSIGQLISKVYSGTLSNGEYKVRIPIEKLGAGIYFYEMTSNSYKEVKKFIVQR
jgi:hypothetical protein